MYVIMKQRTFAPNSVLATLHYHLHLFISLMMMVHPGRACNRILSLCHTVSQGTGFLCYAEQSEAEPKDLLIFLSIGFKFFMAKPSVTISFQIQRTEEKNSSSQQQELLDPSFALPQFTHSPSLLLFSF